MNGISPELIMKHSRSGPRYTSYPTAAEFSSAFGGQQFAEHFTRTLEGKEAEQASLYLHLPFCPSLCYFCACHKVITSDRNLIASFVATLVKEIQSYGQRYGSRLTISQLHLGGGSPSYLTLEEMETVIHSLRQSFPTWASDAELSIELDPRTTDQEKLSLLKKLGFDRLSFGVQDFDAKVQEAIHRIQSFEQTSSLVQFARSEGFSGINMDLIYGLPFQTKESLHETLLQVKKLLPDRIAAYGYAHVPWMNKVQKTLEKYELPTPEERAQLYVQMVKELEAAGYEHLGMDHFALPTDELFIAQQKGYLTRNFMGYTTKRADILLGFGPSAISELPHCYAQNEKELEEYARRIEETGEAIERGVPRTEEDSIRGTLIRTLLCEYEVSLSEWREEHGKDLFSQFPEAEERIRELEKQGIVECTPEVLRITPMGRFFARNVCMEFDAYLPGHQKKPAPRFSQTL